MFSRELFSDNSNKTFLAQPRGHMGIQERLKDINRHNLEAVFEVMQVVVIFRKGQKQLTRNVLNPKSTLAGPSIYDRA